MNDFHSALDSLKNARQVDHTNADSTGLDKEIQGIEEYLLSQERDR